MNEQPAEPLARDENTLDVHSVFYTIQGEGPFSGEAAVFVRLAGCNLQCPGCDTLYTEGRERVAVADLLKRVRRAPADRGYHSLLPLVVITGGEPLRQPIGTFVGSLLEHNYPVQIETNGTCAPDVILDDVLNYHSQDEIHVVCSPKTPKVHPRLARHVGTYKYVVDACHVDPADGLPTSMLGLPHHVARPHAGFRGRVHVTPYDPGPDATEYERGANRVQAADAAMRFGYVANVQVHKVLGLP